MKMYPFLAAVAVALLVAGCGKTEESGKSAAGLPPVLPNAGFEEGMKHWRKSATDTMSRPEAEAAKDGKLGLRVTDTSATEDSRVSTQRFPAKGGTRYNVTFDARSLSGRGVGVFIVFYNSAGERLDLPNGEHVHVEVPEGRTDWKTYEITGRSLPDATEVEVLIRSNNVAVVTADFDNFTLTELAD